MGLFSSDKKQTTTTDKTSNTASTTTPNVPDWIADPAKAMAGNITGLMGQGPEAFAPGMSDLQKQAGVNASGLTTSPYFGQAADQLGNVGDVSADQVQGQSLLDNLQAYYNPYKDQVLNPVLNDYDTQSGITRAAQAAQAAKSGAFQGSRYGIQEGQTEGELARGRAATEGTLLNQMFDTSTGLSSQDAARRQQAAAANQAANLQAAQANQTAGLQKSSILAGLGVSSGNDARANTALQGDIGAAATDIENRAKQYPLTFAAQNEGLLQGINPALFTGSSSTGTDHTTGTDTTIASDPGGGLLKGLGTAASIAGLFAAPFTGGLSLGLGGAGGLSGFGALMCDRRLKKDIVQIGMRSDGLPLYAFRYLWDRIVRYGVMAQDVLKVKPEAVIYHPAGFMMVNTGAL